MTDREIAEQLKRFGDTVKVPIDKKKRPILIKKLNHYYAKENPPPKKGKTVAKSSKLPVRASEFSDDSQDESESGNISKISLRRNKSKNNSFISDSPVKSTLKNRDNGVNITTGTIARVAKNKRISNIQQEIYPDEFSDNDTGDESVYVEEKSIGINTTMNYEEDDSEDDDDDSVIVTHSPSANISTISPSTQSRSAERSRYPVQHDSGLIISKTILAMLAVFFLVLGVCYMYIRWDMFFTNEAALTQTDLKETSFIENGVTYNFSTQIMKGVLPLLHTIHENLATLKGRYELGEVDDTGARLTREDLRKMAAETKDKDELVQLCLLLILRNKKWDIIAYTEDGMTADYSTDVHYLESRYGNLPLSSRVMLALYRVLYGLAMLIMCVLFGVIGIYYLRWQNKRKEKEQQKVYELVEKIIEMLKDNYEVSERKNDPKNYPPYMAVQHVRDQLIPVPKRRQMQTLWDDAVKFIEANESRIRPETQVIQGEEFSVWRWLQAMPNGHKMWQGQAFGETNISSVNSLPYGPTPCLKVRNMFDANTEQNSDDWHLDVEEAVLEKCQDNHGILHIYVDRSSKEGCVYIKCVSCEKAYQAYQALHGWWFDGRLITVKYLRLEHYHERFPDSRNSRRPLQPAKSEMPSISRPYHRSALEMT